MTTQLEITNPILCFVCTGNQFRSPMAEYYFRHHWSGIPLHIISAGTHARKNRPAEPMMVEYMKKHGIDASKHTSLPLTKETIEQAHWLIVMEGNHIDWIETLSPGSINKIHLLKEFDPDPSEKFTDVLDPKGMPVEIFEQCLLTMKEPLNRLMETLRDELENEMNTKPS